MKNWLTQVAVAAFAVSALASCKKDETQATIAPSTSINLTATRTAVVLTQANSAQTALSYTWNTPTFAISNTEYTKTPVVTYQLQVAKTADGFGYPGIIDAGTATSTTKNVTVDALNTALTSIGVAPNAATPVFVRLVAVMGTDNHTFASAPVALTATSFKVCLPPNTDVYSIIGPAGVDWNTDVALTYNCDTRTYDLTRNLNAGEFKFRKNNDWGTNYGSSSNTGGALVSGGGNIAVATAGVKTIKLNLATMTYSIN